MQATGSALGFRPAFRWARLNLLSSIHWILALLAGWALMWFVEEGLVFTFAPQPGQPLWIILHLAYFWWTAYWEAAILAVALDRFDGKRPAPMRVFRDQRLVLRFTLLKLLLIPATLLGIVLLVIPGLFTLGRYGSSFFFLIDRRCGIGEALASAGRATRGKTGRLMGATLIILLFNLLGFALMGVGLVVTLPMTVLMSAYLFGVVDSREMLRGINH